MTKLNGEAAPHCERFIVCEYPISLKRAGASGFEMTMGVVIVIPVHEMYAGTAVR